ncbi:MAG: rhodanese-like domain-containing protein [Rhodospirillaceae bacterium]|jgi:rhodanese-related sulfurtransferase|nr:rhodanese-like domain-containing protein [Rhodospirillaceae bacterium]
MPQKITRSAKDMVAEAEATVRTLDISEALEMHGPDDVVFVDLRDVRELAKTGRIAGARHVPRGMLEFWIDPESSYHKLFFAEDKTFIFYCAGGLRSALAAKTAQDMGLEPVAHLRGGMAAWLAANGAIDPPRDSKSDS